MGGIRQVFTEEVSLRSARAAHRGYSLTVLVMRTLGFAMGRLDSMQTVYFIGTQLYHLGHRGRETNTPSPQNRTL